jgi:hypothetical protein
VLTDTSTADAEALKQAAYDAYEAELTRSYQRNDVKEGDLCIVAPGLPGHWTRNKSGALVCSADRVERKPSASEKEQCEPDDEEWELAGPLSDEDRVRVKDEAYAAYERALVDSWRRKE